MTKMRRSRKTVAFACVALIVLAAVFPLGGATLDFLTFTPAFVLLPATSPAPVSPEAEQRHEQSISLLSIVESRGPPASPHA